MRVRTCDADRRRHMTAKTDPKTTTSTPPAEQRAIMRIVDEDIPLFLVIAGSVVDETPTTVAGVAAGVAAGGITVTAITAYWLKCITVVLTVPDVVLTTPPISSHSPDCSFLVWTENEQVLEDEGHADAVKGRESGQGLVKT